MILKIDVGKYKKKSFQTSWGRSSFRKLVASAIQNQM